jgi:hypothetical protein
MVCTKSLEGVVESDERASNAAADEGTSAHKLLEICLRKRQHPEKYRGKKVLGLKIDSHVIDNVGQAFDYVIDVADRIKGEIHTEVALHIEFLEDGGTADVVVIGSNEVHVMDFKYGRGVVEVVENGEPNKQLMLYLIGARLYFGLGLSKILENHIHVVQPRASHPEGPARSHKVDYKTIKEFHKTTLATINDINEGNTVYAPGKPQCDWCPKKATCPALAKACAKELRAEFSDLISPKPMKSLADNDSLTDDEVGHILSKMPLIYSWMAALEARGLSVLLSGKKLKGFKLVKGKSNRYWDNEDAVKKTFQKLGLSEDDYMPRSLVGIGAGEKLIPKKSRDKIMQNLTKKAEGKPTLVPSSDPRPPIVPSKDDFKQFLKGTKDE